jgi:malonyl-CoA O-methyltransferase
MFDKKIIQKNFSRGAGKYDEVALVQREAAKELVELVVGCQLLVGDLEILDLGSGTSFVTKQILKQVQDDGAGTHKKIFEIDLSAEMLQSWRDRPSNVFPIQGDIENLPFKNHSFDLIISSFSLQWIEDFEKNFSKIFSLLKPNGTFAFCLPTFGSLPELRAENIFNFNDLPKVENLKSALKKSGFVEVFFQTKAVKQNFENGYEALKSLKKIGANYSEKRKKIITKTQLKHFRLKNSQQENKNPYSLTWIETYFILKCSEKF